MNDMNPWITNFLLLVISRHKSWISVRRAMTVNGPCNRPSLSIQSCLIIYPRMSCWFFFFFLHFCLFQGLERPERHALLPDTRRPSRRDAVEDALDHERSHGLQRVHRLQSHRQVHPGFPRRVRAEPASPRVEQDVAFNVMNQTTLPVLLLVFFFVLSVSWWSLGDIFLERVFI